MPPNRRHLILLCLIILAGLLLRLDILIASHFVIDADEAIVGLMGKHMLETWQIPAFYYGQNYMGSFEGILAALLFKFFGISVAVLKLAPLIFSILLIWVVFLLGAELGGARAGLLAALFCAAPPAPLLVWSSKARGGFIEVVFLGAVALLYCCRWLKHPTFYGSLLIGYLLGFGWWVNNQIIFFTAPIGFVMLAAIAGQSDISINSRIKRATQHFAAGAAAWIVGGLPFWVYNLRNDFVSFDIFHRAPAHDALAHLGGLFSVSLPILLGSKRFWEYEDLFPAGTLIICGFYAALLGYILCRRARAVALLTRLKVDRNVPVELFLLFILTACAVFSLSSFGWLIHAPRYLLPVYVGIFVLCGWAVAEIARSHKLAAAVCALFILIANLASTYMHGRTIPGEPFVFKNERVSKDHAELIGWLERNNIDFVRTNYWIGYRLAFETLEKVRFQIFQEPTQVRIKEYEEVVPETKRDLIPLVLVPAQWKLVSEALRELGYTFETADVSNYKVIHAIRPIHGAEHLVGPAVIRASANYAGDKAMNAIDGNPETRWGSAAPQNPTMKFTLEMSDAVPVSRLVYSVGKWRHDMPRALKVELEDASGAHKLLLDYHKSTPIAYYIDASPDFSLYFAPEQTKRIILSQLGKDSFFDWSIAELHLYSTEKP